MTTARATRQPGGEGTAGGKIILMGEHAVVYGASALAAGIRMGVVASVRESAPASASTLSILGRRIAAASDAEHAIARAWHALLAATPSPPVAATVQGPLPAGVGLGFSAATGVALARAVQRLASGADRAEETWAAAMAWESVFHGNPSGVDVAAAMTGGWVRFVRGASPRPVDACRAVVLCVGLSGTTASTSSMVEAVARRRRDEPKLVDGIIRALDHHAHEAERALRAVDLPSLGALMDDGQRLLTELGVSTDKLDRLCALARQSGALGAKLTGSGGGGAAIALVGGLDETGNPSEQARAAARRVLGRWREERFEGFETAVGGPSPPG